MLHTLQISKWEYKLASSVFIICFISPQVLPSYKHVEDLYYRLDQCRN
jgi:hypothetical protein